MTSTELVEQILGVVAKQLPHTLGALANEQRLRLAGLESFVRSLCVEMLEGTWRLIGQYLDAEAECQARVCRCGKRCEARSDDIAIKVLGATVRFGCKYFYCRCCRMGQSPVRRWLGLEHGGASLLLERALSDLTERMTFGDAVDSLLEQQGQSIDRTQAERITYRVCDEAEAYLAQRRSQALAGLEREQRSVGVERLQLTADGGIVPVGKLERPAQADSRACTPVRQLPKGTRSIQGREARLIIVREPHKVTERQVDCHIAPYNHSEFTGERMLAAAAQAGLGDDTKIHGVFDMGSWISSQFQEQFASYPHSACADICHVTHYLTDAGREIVGEQQAARFGMEHKQHMLAGDVELVSERLAQHRCHAGCLRDDHAECLVRVAERYLRNHRDYLDYPPIVAQELPVGSGEAESGVRHLLHKRLDVAGAWTENNARRMLAIISIRASGCWDDFWRWRDCKDRQRWQQRQNGALRSRFRGSPRVQQPKAPPPN